MNEKHAIVIENVYKKFSKPGDPLWKRILKPKSTPNGSLADHDQNGKVNGKNLKNGHGKKKSSQSTKFHSQSMKGKSLGSWGPTVRANLP
ncbi:MAG: hypothetical protein MUO62_06115 [Anaerolineales bacterium]|nr:hypothetical protein [Anaerolineales bacterium]